MDILERHRVKATFFVTGKAVDASNRSNTVSALPAVIKYY